MRLYKRCGCTASTKCAHALWYEFEVRGRVYRRSTRTDNRQTASRIAERRRLAVLDGTDASQIPPTHQLRDHITHYCAFTAAKNATAYKDRAILDRLLAVTGEVAITDVSPFVIERWKLERAKAVSKSTVNRELHVVRGCFSRAVDWHLIATNPCQAVRAYRVDDTRIRVLTDAEIRTVLQEADPTVALICRVTLECLPRLSEVLAIERQHVGPSWVEFRRKGGRVDRAPVSPALHALLVSRGDGCLFGEGPTHQPPYQQRASQRIGRELVRLGIPDASHHTMRHTGVTLMLEAGINPRAIQQLAGWRSLRMLERYGHTRDFELRRAVTHNATRLEQLAGTPPTGPHSAEQPPAESATGSAS